MGKLRRNATGMAFQSSTLNEFQTIEQFLNQNLSTLQVDFQHVHQIASYIATELVVPLATHDKALSSQVEEIQARVLSLDCTIQVCLIGQGKSPNITHTEAPSSMPHGCSSESMCLMKTFAVLSDVSQYMNTIQTVYGSVTIPLHVSTNTTTTTDSDRPFVIG